MYINVIYAHLIYVPSMVALSVYFRSPLGLTTARDIGRL